MKVKILILLTLLFLTGCSDISDKIEKSSNGGKPTELDARKRFEFENKRLFEEGIFKIIEFRKVNAVDHGNQYNLIWKAKIVYLKDASVECCLRDPIYPSGGIIKSGETREFENTYLYFPTEQGWKMRDINGKYIDPY